MPNKLHELCPKYLGGAVSNWNSVFQAYGLHPSKEHGKVAYIKNGHTIKTTLGKFLSRQCGVEIDGSIERGINAITSALMPKTGKALIEVGEFVIVRGPDIVKAYLNNAGSGSCMAGVEASKIVQWYAKFPERIGMLLWCPLHKEKPNVPAFQQAQGRAILWKDDCKRLIIDRIYSGNSELAYERYKAWMKANNAFCLYYGWKKDAKTPIISLGKEALIGKIPYLDTFMYATAGGKFCCNGKDIKARWICRSTSGGKRGLGWVCRCCRMEYTKQEGVRFRGLMICRRCIEDCEQCRTCRGIYRGKYIATVNRRQYCTSCVHAYARKCVSCKKWKDSTQLSLDTPLGRRDSTGKHICKACEKKQPKCQKCKGKLPNKRRKLCDGCKKPAKSQKVMAAVISDEHIRYFDAGWIELVGDGEGQ